MTLFASISVMIGAALGALLRYFVSLHLPLPVLFVNILGSLIIGYSYAKLSISHKELLPFINTGILGGLTTFSSFSLDMVQDLQQGFFLKALVYALASVIVGVFACFLGFKLSQLA